jgi:hypothetical protein
MSGRIILKPDPRDKDTRNGSKITVLDSPPDRRADGRPHGAPEYMYLEEPASDMSARSDMPLGESFHVPSTVRRVRSV